MAFRQAGALIGEWLLLTFQAPRLAGMAVPCHIGAMGDANIHAKARILEKRSPVLYWVSLPNGKRVLAHLAKRLVAGAVVFAPGEEVVVEMSPYDFDTARILRPA